MVKKDDPHLIANFVNQTNQANATTLDILCLNSSREIFEKVLEKVNFPQQALVDMASTYAVALQTDNFLVLLNKIVTPEDQENVVERRIGKLVSCTTDTSPLLSALKGKTFLSKRLEHLAVQKAFMWGVKRGMIDRLSDDIYKHAAITPELYANALIVTA